MATIENRSKHIISVKNRDDLYREFPFNRENDAQAYFRELKEQHFKPMHSRMDDAFLVRIREKGQRPFQHTFSSLDEAQAAIGRIEAERKTGLFIDYTSSHNVTFEQLVRRYMVEEGPKKKGWEKVEQYKCKGWLEDLDNGLTKRIAQEKASAAKSGKKPRQVAMRAPVSSLQWMRKPFAAILTTDIEEYVNERLDEVTPATVDRELDVMRAVFTVATTVWKHRLAENPMDAVRRPKYFNERDRRLKNDEEQRLLAAAIKEDKRRSIEVRVEELMAESRLSARQMPTTYAKKKFLSAALEQSNARAQTDYVHVALVETVVQFLLMTAARRGEALKLRWTDVDFEGRSAFLAETKNGLPRSLPLRAKLVEMLKRLPRTSDAVFDLSEDALRKAWARMLKHAGIDDLHIHDLRHEAVSRVAESGKFALIDLQKFSGHRDVRMLLRYSHLCTKRMAEKLDEAFASESQASHHRGRQRGKSARSMELAAEMQTPVGCNVIPLFKRDAA